MKHIGSPLNTKRANFFMTASKNPDGAGKAQSGVNCYMLIVIRKG